MKSSQTKFLLADDDPDDLELFEEALTETVPDAQFASVENGEEVLSTLSQQGKELPDLIFLDINMPVMDGWECLKKLKDKNPFSAIPVIMYSTSSAAADIEMAYKLGAFAFLTKPDDYNELASIIRTVARTPIELLLQRLSEFESIKLRSGS
jgi:CheY-like chemotaxis protein